MYIIVNISEVHDWGYDQILPEERRPKYIHTFVEDAEAELLRLKQRAPEGEFVIFEAVTRVRTVTAEVMVHFTEQMRRE